MKNKYTSTIPSDEIPFSLPDNWGWFRWSDLMVSYQQGMIRSNGELGAGNVYYLKMGDLNGDGTATIDSLTRANASINEIEQYSLKEGDFLINVRNSKELVGKTCITPEITNGPVLFNHMLVRIDHGNKDLNYFVNAFLNIPISRKLLDRVKQGTTTVIALYQRDLNNIPIAVPDQKTFDLIVSAYKNLLKKCSVNNRINAELEAMAKTIYDYWFVQFDFPISKEQAKSMGKPQLQGKPYKDSGGKMVWNKELKREVPAIWKAETLSSIIEFNPALSLPKGTESSYIDMDALPQNGFMSKAPMKKAFNGGMKFQNGDVAVARITPCLENGKTGLITQLKEDEIGFGSTEFIILRGRKFDLRSYASCLARSAKFRAYAISKMTGTSGRKRVSASDLEMYVAAIPDDDTLKRFEQLVSPFFEKMTSSALENQKLAELRDWLLPMLMNGQVRIKEKVRSKVIDTTKNKSDFKPESLYDYQSQIFALIADVSRQNRVKHGEMTIAKYAYLIDKVKGIPTFFEYGRHHLGPWAKEMKKVLLNKKNFKIDDEGITVVSRDLLMGNIYEKEIHAAIGDLASIFSKYKNHERSYQTELLATVCKVIEDIQSIDLKAVRQSMKEWPIKLETSKFKNKAEKFSDADTQKCLREIIERKWHLKLIQIR